MELYLPSSQTSSRLFGTNIMMPMQFQMAFKTHLCKYIINNKIKMKLQTFYEITSRVVVVMNIEKWFDKTFHQFFAFSTIKHFKLLFCVHGSRLLDTFKVNNV